MEAARLVDLRQIPQGNQEAEKFAFGQRVADAVVTLVPDYGLVLPLQATASATGTTGTALPYQSVVEVHNRLVVVIFSGRPARRVRVCWGVRFSRVYPISILRGLRGRAAGMTKETPAGVDAACLVW